jgi:hypothetical protein
VLPDQGGQILAGSDRGRRQKGRRLELDRSHRRPRVQQQDLLGPFTKVSARLTVLEEGEYGAADAAVAAHDENAIRAPGSRTHVPTSVRRRPPSPIVSNITDSMGSSTVPVPCA